MKTYAKTRMNIKATGMPEELKISPYAKVAKVMAVDLSPNPLSPKSLNQDLFNPVVPPTIKKVHSKSSARSIVPPLEKPFVDSQPR
jgi:hypothetical protein